MLAFSAHAQFGGLTPSGVNAAFIRVFSPHTTFQAQAEVRVVDKQGKEWVRMPTKFSALDGNLRFEIDLAGVESASLPDFAKTTLQDSGMDKVVSIVRSDKRATFVVYPGMQCYLNLPLSPEDAKAAEKGYRVESTAPQKEVLDGKERMRSQLTIKESTGAVALDATVWRAPDLKDFPVKIETRQEDKTIVLTFSQVQFAKPASKDFDLPADFEEYKDAQKMMYGIMKKIVASSMGTSAK
jgi:hypothetical protein